MRCHPGVSYPLERLVPEGGTELCGKKLRAGTVVGINPVVVHQNTEIYGRDAALFRPERWMEADQEHLKVMDRTLLTVSHIILPILCFLVLIFINPKCLLYLLKNARILISGFDSSVLEHALALARTSQ